MENREDIPIVEINNVLQVIKHTYGYDFTNYAKASLQRRVIKFMGDSKMDSIYDLKFRLLNDPATFQQFIETITVNVTELFRDPSFYKMLGEKVLPTLASYPIIKIWHAGCSSGEEVYSMCILLHEAGLLQRTRIYATDINPSNLKKSIAGIIPLHLMKDYTTNYIQAGGKYEFSDYYTARYNKALIKNEIRKNVVFSQHNLVTDNVFNEFQLICCRNVMIYFDKELQNKVTRLFYESLSPLGFLTLGSKESLLFSDVRNEFETIDRASRIFRRKA
jgi:chemotaxis protein methyltransferase CheR